MSSNAVEEVFHHAWHQAVIIGLWTEQARYAITATGNFPYPAGWAHAMDTPFQWTKQIASHFGGTRNALVMSWPARIKDKGGFRTQVHHVIDIVPTILEAVGLEMPSVLNGVPQKPVEGVSMVYTFDDAKAPSQHRTQYFEMFANRAIYNDGWVAATTPPIVPWVSIAKPVDIDDYKWELYNVNDDFSQAVNLADKEPRKLRELQDLFWVEAAKYNVLPIDDSRVERFDVQNLPSLTRGRSVFTYYDGQTRIPEGSAPDMQNKSFEIAAEVEMPTSGADGMLMTHGGRFSGYGFYLLDGKLVYHYNAAKMPFKFMGTLKKVIVTLGEDKLSDADRKAIDEARAQLGLSR